MQELDDHALLREYAERGSETAFAGLVTRHVNKVYSVALRHTGNPHQAEEITQAVFVILARKARGLSPRVILSGWLYQTARLTAVTFVRSDIRRAQREQEACMQNTPQDGPEVWTQIAPLLDRAMADLSEKDRHALVLRYFDGLSLKSVGDTLGSSEEAAKMRVNRAVEKLRRFFTKRGVSVAAAALAAAMATHSVQAAPVTLAKSVTAVALAKGATASLSTLTLITGTLKVMAWTQTKTAVVGAIVVALAALTVVQHQNQVKLREENESLQKQLAQALAKEEQLSARRPAVPHLPAPMFQVAVMATNSAPADTAVSTNLYSRLYDRLKDQTVNLTREQVDSYLNANGRNASTLLAAFRTSRDLALLKEAMEKYPNDPQVGFEAVAYNISHSKDVPQADQRKWLDAFAKSAPDNALANYLSAINYFNAGQIDQGVQDLAAASTKSLDDYTVSRAENDMEAFLAAGYSVADSEVLGTSQLLLPQLAQLKQLALNAADLAKTYRQTGDTASAQAVALMADRLGEQYATTSPGEPTVSQLVGIAIEKIALGTLDPNAPYGENGQTVQDRLNQLAQQRASVQQTSEQVSTLLPSLTDPDWVIYKNRWMMFGEQNAQQWIIGKYGQQ